MAAWVFRSLKDHPDLRFPAAIAAGPASDRQADVSAIGDALDELKARGLVEEEPGRGWKLTDAALSQQG